ncbi:PREDICTED: probable long-chain-alcohol O-fatty-acyltransferase 7 isoform X1 [Brassica oleracea var. oleracea]|uniref:probable long-chain-alcohol O-fatty-acyltransferase 7 isoform X1 n=1 Tax=Brassica oleracea var. oleracea TaxID=109376 RepID=UPI0006A6A753|nr:PREDICTED: probable long-chain-alcohol O-fatty-acyltransferase 7 isoform X1 [Brassica oleracea var. oleracea]
MEEELNSLVKVGVSTIMSVSYCFFLPPRIKSGFFRLISILPVCVLFLVLPLFLSFPLFSSPAAILLILADLKLILFSFDQGPLSPLPSNIFLFTCFTCFPIQRQKNPKPQAGGQDQMHTWIFAIKVVLLGVVLHLYHWKTLPPIMLLGLYPPFLYVLLEVSLTLFRILLTIILKCNLEPHFKEPYLATSLQDFWGRRWNLLVSASLRACVYTPVRRVCQRLMCSDDSAMLISVLATFIVSVCTVGEVAVKRTAFAQRWVVRQMLSRLLTVGFVVVTTWWLFFPPWIRSNVTEKCFNEASLLIDFLRRKLIFLYLKTQVISVN